MKRLAFIFLLASLLRNGWAVVAFNNTNTMTTTGGSLTATGAFSVTAGGSNLVAIACVATDRFNTETATVVTYGGNVMTSAGTAANNATTNSFTELFYLVNPPTGSNTLSVTVTAIGASGSDIYMNLVSFTGVNQTTPERSSTYGTATANSANPQLVVTSNSNDLTVTCLDSGNPGIQSTNQTSDGSIMAEPMLAPATMQLPPPRVSLTHGRCQ